MCQDPPRMWMSYPGVGARARVPVGSMDEETVSRGCAYVSEYPYPLARANDEFAPVQAFFRQTDTVSATESPIIQVKRKGIYKIPSHRHI
jgi:hypothetical protein